MQGEIRRFGHFGALGSDARNRASEGRGDQGGRGGATVGRFSRQHLVADDGQAVLVGTAVHRALAHRLLGCHVGWRTDARPGVGELRLARNALPDRTRDAEIGHQRGAILGE